MRILLLSLIVLLSSCVHKPVEWEKVEQAISVREIPKVRAGAYPIMQGPTGLKTSHLVLLRPLEQTLKYYIKFDNQVVNITPQSKDLMYSDYSLDFLEVNSFGDKLHELYVFNERGQLIDHREFLFLNPAKENLKVLVASCMSDDLKALQEQMWDQAFGEAPDLMLLIGDNVYADSGVSHVNPKTLTRRYIETRLQLKAFRQPKLVPTFSVWDDHDFGKNNGGADFKWKKHVSELFPQFFPQRELEGFYQNGPGLSSKILFKGFDVTLFDNRSFRTGSTHFGQEQEEWFLKNLNPDKLNILVSGDQWFGGYHQFESYEGNHPESFKKFLSELKKTKARVLFVSGDRHLTELMKIPSQVLGRESYELTSSGIHANMYPGSFEKNPNPRQMIGVDGKVNYALIEVPNQKRSTSVLIKSQGQDHLTLFEKRLQLH